MVSKKNNPLFVWRLDRKSLSFEIPVITEQAFLCYLVILQTDLVYPSLTLPIDSYSLCLESYFY